MDAAAEQNILFEALNENLEICRQEILSFTRVFSKELNIRNFTLLRKLAPENEYKIQVIYANGRKRWFMCGEKYSFKGCKKQLKFLNSADHINYISGDPEYIGVKFIKVRV